MVCLMERQPVFQLLSYLKIKIPAAKIILSKEAFHGPAMQGRLAERRVFLERARPPERRDPAGNVDIGATDRGGRPG